MKPDGHQKVGIRLRRHQHEAIEALDKTRFGVLICHRRFGKTVAAIVRLIRNAVNTKRRAHRAAYIAPLYRQAKAVTWDYARFFAGNIPGVTFLESDLSVRFPNGARISLHGADNPDSLRGLDLCDVVFDEVADMPGRVWTEIVLPMLVSNDGGALFIGTPRGKNALYDIWTDAHKDARMWTARMYRASETGIISAASLDIARNAMDADEYAQEFECSFAAGVKGAYYAHLLDEAEAEGRIGDVALDKALPVMTSWDLGVADMTAIWFYQDAGPRDLRCIDYYEADGEGLPHYVDMLRARGYTYGQHYAPPDIRVREFGTGKSRLETAASLGLYLNIAPALSLADGIQAVRNVIPVTRFNRIACESGITALRHYRQKYDDKRDTYRSAPLHDWAEHGSSSFRYMAVSRAERFEAALKDKAPLSGKKEWGF